MPEQPGPFGVIGAMDLEVELLREAMVGATHSSTGAGECSCGAIDGIPCVVVQSGVGMVAAAACAQMLVDRFDVSCVVNTGVAGSLSPSVEIGDLVVATRAVNWAMDVQNLGYAPGQTPGLPSAFLPLSDTLAEVALEAARVEGAVAHAGLVASGDRFVREAAERKRIAGAFGALCCEMEGAAIAQVCWRNQVPCAILRVVSDTADGVGEEDYPAFEAAAAKRCAAIVRRLLALAPSA